MAPEQVAIVTGASRGIGRHLADAFAAHGYAVERSSLTGGDDAAALDVADAAAVFAYVADVARARGRIDVLVNNAGVVDAEVPIEESDPRQWWRTVEVDVRGPYLLTRAVLPVMLAAGSGRIINLNSGAGTHASTYTSAYYVGKTALTRVTGAAHLSGRGRGVHAFDLAPGVVATDMTASMRVHDDRTEWTPPEVVAELAIALASGRLDAWSGRMVRAGADSPDRLAEAAAAGLPAAARTVGLLPYGDADPLG